MGAQRAGRNRLAPPVLAQDLRPHIRRPDEASGHKGSLLPGDPQGASADPGYAPTDEESRVHPFVSRRSRSLQSLPTHTLAGGSQEVQCGATETSRVQTSSPEHGVDWAETTRRPEGPARSSNAFRARLVRTGLDCSEGVGSFRHGAEQSLPPAEDPCAATRLLGEGWSREACSTPAAAPQVTGRAKQRRSSSALRNDPFVGRNASASLLRCGCWQNPD